MLNKQYLRRNVPLPPDLSYDAIFDALEATQDFFKSIRVGTNIILSSIIQANNFSGVVSNVFTVKLNDVSNYKSFSDQRYPDLMHISNGTGLEVKASNKPLKGGEGHNGHSGWHIVVCYTILDNGDIEFTHVEIANLVGFECEGSDWKYMGSRRNENDSQRTETYVTNNVGTAKLRDGSVYLNPEFVTISNAMKTGRLNISELPIPTYSPLQ
ncbi:MAG: hypothetical protein LUE25_07955 [Clostridiales bacterium]|nr:hypothetical protein [Clostridiales bacterium]